MERLLKEEKEINMKEEDMDEVLLEVDLKVDVSGSIKNRSLFFMIKKVVQG